jgi:hypothetical protein
MKKEKLAFMVILLFLAAVLLFQHCFQVGF